MNTTWTKGIRIPSGTKFSGDISTDVVIIGGGMAGIVSAYFLGKLGKKVVVVEKGELGLGVTSLTTAFLSSDIDTDLSDLVKIYGTQKAADIWDSGKYAISLIERILEEEHIECQWKRIPEYWYATSKRGYKKLKKEAILASELGYPVREISVSDLMNFDHAGGFLYDYQAKFHPLMYLSVLIEKAKSHGVTFFDHTEALVVGGDEEIFVETTRGTVSARCVIMSTYYPFQNPARLFLKKGTYYSYIYELAIPKGSLPEATYLDDMNPYHYFRIDPGDREDRMIIGGEDHRVELPIDPEKNFEALRCYLSEYFPELEYRVEKNWYGPVLESIDGLPFIGRYDARHPNRYIMTAFSGNGMTYSHIAADIVSAAIEGKESPYASLYDPMRFHLKPVSLFVKTKDYIGALFGGYMKNIWRKGTRWPSKG